MSSFRASPVFSPTTVTARHTLGILVGSVMKATTLDNHQETRLGSGRDVRPCGPSSQILLSQVWVVVRGVSSDPGVMRGDNVLGGNSFPP